MNNAMDAINGPASWLTLGLFALAAVAVATLLWFSQRMARRYPHQSLQVHCPGTGTDLESTSVYDVEQHRWIEVERCAGPQFPRCARGCLKAANQT